jgi:TPP-dependent pyruvate/acetoin dehydrogenase alpha subunit
MSSSPKNKTDPNSNTNDADLYREMLRIRLFEETVLEEFQRGRFLGTTHTYIGQEANAVGVLSNFSQEDVVVSNHRSHGHFLAYGGDMRGLFAEMMGKPTGVCGGRGGSQHIHWKNFYSNGILGGTAPIATGIAMEEKIMARGLVTVAFLGDGALGEGVVYEAFNMASLWSVPILFVLENNKIAQTTPIRINLAGDIPQRFSAFGIPTNQLYTSDVLMILSAAKDVISDVRQSRSPRALILNTCRFGPHSKGDDPRPKEEINKLRKTRDPLTIHAKRLPTQEIKAIEEDVRTEVEQAFQQALTDPF